MYKVGGLLTTVHARSKTAAIKLLREYKPGIIFRVVLNDKCCPEALPDGDHCLSYLVTKDVDDPTPLGAIEPNSPEWERRVHFTEIVISPRRQKVIDRMHQRKDVYGPE
ncbi:hypothetical protein IID19_03455 [Patescibacteria group bacterium]|nr:hypothetical protein [Patescibacteria group bacterium]